MKMPNVSNVNMEQAKEAYSTLFDISKLLGTDVDCETLAICTRLCEAGVNPQCLANILYLIHSEVNKAEKSKNENNQH